MTSDTHSIFISKPKRPKGRPPWDGLPVLTMADQKGKAMYIIKTRNGSKLFTSEQIINNAKEQERAGVRPSFAWMDYKTGTASTPPGWLVWSTMEGCRAILFASKKRKPNCFLVGLFVVATFGTYAGSIPAGGFSLRYCKEYYNISKKG